MKRSSQLLLTFLYILTVCLAVFITVGHYKDKKTIQLQKNENTYLRSALNYFNHSPGEERKQAAYKYINPVYGDDYIGISSPFGIRNNPLRKNMGGEEIRQHYGVDLTGTWHGRVVAVAPGKVDGFVSGYGHLSSIYVHEGEHVKTSQVIGRIGSTGKSTGEHLHFSIQDSNGSFLQPLKYINVD